MAKQQSDSITLPLNRRIADRPPANRLPLPFADTPLGYSASTLALPFTKHISDQPAAHRLPLPFTRRLGAGMGGSVTITSPPHPKRRMGVFSCLSFAVTPVVSVAHCHDHQRRGGSVAATHDILRERVRGIASCSALQTTGMTPLANCRDSHIGVAQTIANCGVQTIEGLTSLHKCSRSTQMPVISYTTCGSVRTAAITLNQ